MSSLIRQDEPKLLIRDEHVVNSEEENRSEKSFQNGKNEEKNEWNGHEA